MRIGFITTSFDEHRGGNKIFSDLFRTLKNIHDFTVITTKISAESPSWETIKIKSKQFSHKYWVNDYLFARAVIKELRSIQRRERFDLIVVNQVIGASIVKLRDFGIPVIYMVHHPVSVDIKLAVDESNSLKEKLRWKFRYGFMFRIQKKLTQKFDYILTVSQSSKERLTQDYDISPDKIKVIFNGIDGNFFKKTLSTKPKTILAVGSYQHPRRGFKYLIEVYKRVASLGYTILDVGRRTREQGKSLSLISNLQQLGVVESGKLPDLYSMASVFVSTSLFEGFGLSVGEALACETPAVAFRAGGVEEVLDSVNSELICEIRNIDQMVQKITNFEKDVSGSKLRKAILEKFSLEKMVENYDNYFSSLIK